MSNYKFKLAIESVDIYNKLLPEQKELFYDIKITDVTLCGDKTAIIECLALTEETIERPAIQRFHCDGYLSAT